MSKMVSWFRATPCRVKQLSGADVGTVCFIRQIDIWRPAGASEFAQTYEPFDRVSSPVSALTQVSDLRHSPRSEIVRSWVDALWQPIVLMAETTCEPIPPYEWSKHSQQRTLSIGVVTCPTNGQSTSALGRGYVKNSARRRHIRKSTTANALPHFCIAAISGRTFSKEINCLRLSART